VHSFINYTGDVALFSAAQSLGYLTGAMVYHCQRLAQLYVEIARIYTHIAGRTGTSETTAVFAWQVEPYYEFDSMMAAARRTYDSMRFVLWPRFGHARAPMPRSLSALLDARTTMPEQLRIALADSWQRVGTRVTAYRDCAHHYVPVDFHQAAFMRRHGCGCWYTTMRIPDNPEARSTTKFNFSGGLDALTFAWETADEVVRIAGTAVSAVEQAQPAAQSAPNSP
jgi:hypothetical protein